MQHLASSWANGDPPGSAPSPGSPAPFDARSQLPNAVLAGRYRVLELVGEGRHGTVYRAEAIPTGQLVALKCLELGQGQREAALLGCLEHPLLPRLVELLTAEASACLVMEWIAGKPLWNWSSEARGPRAVLSLAEVFAIGFQLCTVFGYLHGLVPPIWYQDLHEGNVLRLADGRIRLIDVGRARRLTPGEEAKRHDDIADIRHLLSRLLLPTLSNEVKWRVRGAHPSLQPEDAHDLRVALEALMQELGAV